MELFSLGIEPRRRGNYTEQDIREAARAFTGWDIDNGRAVFEAEPARRRRQDRPRPARQLRRRGHRPHLPGAGVGALLHRRQAVPLPGQRDDPAHRRSCWSRWRAHSAKRLRLRRPRRDGPALEPVLLAASLPDAGQVAGRFRARHRPRPGRPRARRAHASAGWGPRAGRRLEGLGQRLFYPPSVTGWEVRPRLAQRPDAAVFGKTSPWP